MSVISVFDIKRQNKILKIELDETIASVIDRGAFILGSKVAEFEREFAKYIGVKYAVGVASGTDAISLALLAVGVGRGDEVIIPANAYPSVFAIYAAGAIPKPVDIDPSTFNIDPSKIPAAISKKTKAILPVHLYGQPADMEAILHIGQKYKIPVVEDCAQAHGAEVMLNVIPTKRSARRNLSRMRDSASNVLRDPSTSLGMTDWYKVGSIGDIGCFSFYPTKNLGAFGDGGIVVTNNSEIYKKLKLLRMYGEESRYKSILLGRNSRLDELQAAILLVKLKYLDGWNVRRREIAQLYFTHFFGRSKKLGKERAASGGFPIEVEYAQHTFHLFVIRIKKRDQLKKYLEGKGIGTAIHYPVPIHLVPSMRYLGYKKGDFPETEKACREILSLPMFPELRESEVEKVTEAIKNFH